MTLTLELSPDLETRLSHEAAVLGVPVEKYAMGVLEQSRPQLFDVTNLGLGPKLLAWDRISPKLCFARVPERSLSQTVVGLPFRIKFRHVGRKFCVTRRSRASRRCVSTPELGHEDPRDVHRERRASAARPQSSHHAPQRTESLNRVDRGFRPV